MPLPEELKQKLLAEIEVAIDAVGDCPMTEGALLPILNQAARKISQTAAEGLTKIAADKAAFSPSALSPLRQGEDQPARPATAQPANGARGDCA